MFYVCIERKNGERIVASSAVSRFRIDSSKTSLQLQGPSSATSEYTPVSDSVFFTESHTVAKDFLMRRSISEEDMKLIDRLFYGKWEERRNKNIISM